MSSFFGLPPVWIVNSHDFWSVMMCNIFMLAIQGNLTGEIGAIEKCVLFDIQKVFIYLLTLIFWRGPATLIPLQIHRMLSIEKVLEGNCTQITKTITSLETGNKHEKRLTHNNLNILKYPKLVSLNIKFLSNKVQNEFLNLCPPNLN